MALQIISISLRWTLDKQYSHACPQLIYLYDTYAARVASVMYQCTQDIGRTQNWFQRYAHWKHVKLVSVI